MWLFHQANVSELKNTFIYFDVLNENACERQFFSACIIIIFFTWKTNITGIRFQIKRLIQ